MTFYSLEECLIDDEGATEIAIAIRENNYLAYLDLCTLYWNKFDSW